MYANPAQVGVESGEQVPVSNCVPGNTHYNALFSGATHDPNLSHHYPPICVLSLVQRMPDRPLIGQSETLDVVMSSGQESGPQSSIHDVTKRHTSHPGTEFV